MSRKPMCECNQGRLPCTCTPQHLIAQLQQDQKGAAQRIAVLENAYIRAGWREHELRIQLAERAGLLRECFTAMLKGGYSKPLRERIKAALTASAEPTSGDWIAWSGGECPVSAETEVEYSMLGNPSKVSSSVAGRLDWQHDSRPSRKKPNICRYRVRQRRDSAEPSAPVERGSTHGFEQSPNTCRHLERSGVWWREGSITRTGRECNTCGSVIEDPATEASMHEFIPFTNGCSKCGEPYSTEDASHETQ
ncbi:hypothetical protein ACI2KO_11970 [Pseudomonas piscis]|uniref:hypothetical protein n=1 Tax=Pseudomonas piscis TaxID=2614538 RepID=UPI00384FBFD8